MIILLNGPIGVGKTTTALYLLPTLGRVAMIDGELLTLIRPFNPHSLENFDSACRAMRILLDHHARNGFAAFLITWILETPELMRRFLAALPVTSRSSVRSFLLLCEDDELIRRIKTRDRPDMAREICRSRELSAVLRKAAPSGTLGHPIDTTHIGAKQVAQMIYRSVAVEHR